MTNQNEVKLIITADNKSAISGVDNVGNSLKTLEQTTGSLVSMFKSHWLTFGGAIYGAKKAMDFFIFDTANAAEELKRLSFQTSVGTDMLQAFKQVALTSGVHLNELSLGLFQLSQRLADAANDVGDSRNVFQALGIGLYDTKGRLRDTGDLFIDTSKKFANMADGFQKIDLVEKVFGRGSKAILPMFQELSENIDEIKNKQPIFSEDEINQAKQFNDNIAITKEHFKELGYVVGNVVIPNLNEFFDVLKKGTIPENSWVKLIDPWGLMNQIGKSPLATSWEWFKKLIGIAEEYTDKLAGIKTEMVALQSIRLQSNPVFAAFGLPGEFTQNIKIGKSAVPHIFDEKKWLKEQNEFEKAVGEAFREEGRLAAGVLKNEEEAAKRGQEVYADMYEALRFDTERYYDFQKGLLEQRRVEEIAVTGDIALAWEVFYARLQELEEQRILRTNDFVGGIKVFYAELEREGFTLAQGAKGMMEDFASGGASALSGFLDKIETDTKNIGEHLKDFITDFSDAFRAGVNRMISEWLMLSLLTGIGGFFGSMGARSMGVGGTAGTTQAGGWGTPEYVGNMSPQADASNAVIVQQTVQFNISTIDGPDTERFFRRNAPIIQRVVGDGIDQNRAFAAKLRGNR